MGEDIINQNSVTTKLYKKQKMSKSTKTQRACPDILQMIGEDPNDASAVKTVDTEGLSKEQAKSEFESRVCEASGYNDHELGLIFLTQTNEALCKNNDSLKDSVIKLNVLAKTMHSLHPKDAIEGQLIAQLIILHEQSIEWLGRALRTDQTNFANICLNGASKLLNRHHETLASLLKYRRGDEQRVHVEHVHVHSGGQAIVGNVTSKTGIDQNFEEGPHAKV